METLISFRHLSDDIYSELIYSTTVFLEPYFSHRHLQLLKPAYVYAWSGIRTPTILWLRYVSHTRVDEWSLLGCYAASTVQFIVDKWSALLCTSIYYMTVNL